MRVPALFAAILFIVSTANAAQSRALVCLYREVKLPQGRQLVVPKSAVFRNHGPISGDISGSWRIIEPRGSKQAALVTLEPITLSNTKRCADVAVSMYVDGILFRETAASAADRDHWSLADVPEYTPGRKPPIEFGKLIDDMSLLAQLRIDVTEVIRMPASMLAPGAEAAQCLGWARAVADEIGGSVGRQTSMVTFIRHPAVQEISLGCRMPRPHLFAAWGNGAMPSTASAQIITRAASRLTGAPQGQVASLMTACIRQALKPENNETVDVEDDGLRAECQAFRRDGGAGAVTIFRRLGRYPNPDLR